ncbi:MAG: hypothetical protein KME49_08780 [Brasilonema octagenarum HA4186-MV1]|uniref:YtkA-like domain-containing protein n=2 Tax=Brasilonema TaxID=383614 RepID=A0A856ML06_9CYAN|nr:MULTISPECIES: hypothetical protein [Brasilonema]MBW4625581.1 hypothetical protein [Brasilonema octagenarum HA4186-MV1]NMF66664.1 hypothetical protein [Brasilonema octagenarum UFV-OR1]QDL11222.1 hypothetical protein DP114_28000 [Brasilonema sennae CENA114]QDL17567.1 hypothetical protein DP113_27930 [Brasilonema octagenarum UFV-E1]
MTVLATTATLLFAQSCSTSPNAQESSTAVLAQQHNDQHSTQAENHTGHSMNDSSDTKTNAAIQAKLTVPETVAVNAPVPLIINVQDATAKPIDKFDVSHEKLMHLIVVSDDLRFFDHLHPRYEGNGRFTVEAQLPQSGGYTLFSDYKPSGQTQQVSTLKTQVPGNSSSSPDINFKRSQTFTNTKVNLELSTETVKAGEEVAVTFNLKGANNQPVTDLQPYMGERGHLVILRQSTSLTSADYIHAHAVKDTTPGRVQFVTSFPKPGLYKLWGQFNRNGKIVTADFWVKAN